VWRDNNDQIYTVFCPNGCYKIPASWEYSFRYYETKEMALAAAGSYLGRLMLLDTHTGKKMAVVPRIIEKIILETILEHVQKETIWELVEK
jgi:hypothetical protein